MPPLAIFPVKLSRILKILISLGKLTHSASSTLIWPHLLDWRRRLEAMPKKKIPSPHCHQNNGPGLALRGFIHDAGATYCLYFDLSYFPYLFNKITHISFPLISLFHFIRTCKNRKKSPQVLWFCKCASAWLQVKLGRRQSLSLLFRTCPGWRWGSSCLELKAGSNLSSGILKPLPEFFFLGSNSALFLTHPTGGWLCASSEQRKGNEARFSTNLIPCFNLNFSIF